MPDWFIDHPRDLRHKNKAEISPGHCYNQGVCVHPHHLKTDQTKPNQSDIGDGKRQYSGRHVNKFGNVFKIALNRARPNLHEFTSTTVIQEILGG